MSVRYDELMHSEMGSWKICQKDYRTKEVCDLLDLDFIYANRSK